MMKRRLNTMNFGGCREWKKEKSERKDENWEMGGGQIGNNKTTMRNADGYENGLWRIGEQENRGLVTSR